MSLMEVETSLKETTIRMRFADDTDPNKASYWIDFQLPLGELQIPISGGHAPIGNHLTRQLGSIQLAALHLVRDAINAQIQGLASVVRQ